LQLSTSYAKHAMRIFTSTDALPGSLRSPQSVQNMIQCFPYRCRPLELLALHRPLKKPHRCCSISPATLFSCSLGSGLWQRLRSGWRIEHCTCCRHSWLSDTGTCSWRPWVEVWSQWHRPRRSTHPLPSGPLSLLACTAAPHYSSSRRRLGPSLVPASLSCCPALLAEPAKSWRSWYGSVSRGPVLSF